MATPFTTIYKKFLAMVDDYEFAIVTDEELSEILFEYLDRSRSIEFPQCTKDLESIVETGSGLGEFTETLTSQEQHILALGMKKAWLSVKLNNADLMRKEIGDRDYKTVQGTNYLKEISKLETKIEEEIRNYAVSYTYKTLSEVEW